MYWLSFIFSTYTLIPDIVSSRPASLEAVKLVQSKMHWSNLLFLPVLHTYMQSLLTKQKTLQHEKE